MCSCVFLFVCQVSFWYSTLSDRQLRCLPLSACLSLLFYTLACITVFALVCQQTGEMEVRNPLFRGDDTPVTPGEDITGQPHGQEPTTQPGNQWAGRVHPPCCFQHPILNIDFRCSKICNKVTSVQLSIIYF